MTKLALEEICALEESFSVEATDSKQAKAEEIRQNAMESYGQTKTRLASDETHAEQKKKKSRESNDSIREDGLDYEGLCWFYSLDRRGRCHIGFGAGRAFCISHETKPNSSLFLSLIVLSGDICPNPGPHDALDLCGICMKSVKSNQRGICCDLCKIWFHVRRQYVNMRA